VWDPFFAPDPRPLLGRYDFVACTEAAEHFFRPEREVARMFSLLRPGGWLGVMTQWMEEGRDLAGWRYARDPTHVVLYRVETLRWIAARAGAVLELASPGVALFRVGGPRAHS
jgi:hypothetical protein